MTINTTRFGDIDFSSEELLHFDEGLIGFPELHDYVLFDHKPDSPFRWLQSIDLPDLAFLLAEPTHFVPEYGSAISTHGAFATVLTTVAIPPGKPEEMTLNLAGPILIDATTRKARQVVLDDGSYTVKHRVFEGSKSVGEQAAA